MIQILFVITIILLGFYLVWLCKRDSKVLPVDKNSFVILPTSVTEYVKIFERHGTVLPPKSSLRNIKFDDEDFIPEDSMYSKDLKALVSKPKTNKKAKKPQPKVKPK